MRIQLYCTFLISTHLTEYALSVFSPSKISFFHGGLYAPGGDDPAVQYLNPKSHRQLHCYTSFRIPLMWHRSLDNVLLR